MNSIVIAGSLAQKPGRGGHTWVFLQYVLGFAKLGWDVTFLDRLEPEMCTDETGARAPLEAFRERPLFPRRDAPVRPRRPLRPAVRRRQRRRLA